MKAGRLSVDQLLTPVAVEEFAERTAAGAETIRAAGLTDTSVAIGGVGLGAHGLDPYANRKEFDADLAVPEAEFERMADRWSAQHPGETHNDRELHFPKGQKTLSLTVLRSPFPDSVATHLGARTYDELRAKAVVVNGIVTLPAGQLALAKVRRAEDRDFEGLAMAQIRGWATRCEAIEDVDWKTALKMTLHSVILKNTMTGGGLFRPRGGLPPWLGRLASNHFDHPAFRSIVEFEMPRWRH